ncbi:MAG: formylglycine-generating enzyme family protein [Bacteroidales bacterium]|nr:formylglycine-generating enzyme family protein [Bacteroidales bacterium]
MKKLICMGMGLALCLSAAVWTGCDKPNELETPAMVEEIPSVDGIVADLESSMVYVEGGMFMMGATEEQGEDAWYNERPVHEVTLDGFYIGKYEVTQAQWKAVMGTTVVQQRDKVGTSYGLHGVGDDYPMYYVSWNDAVEFCEKLSAQTGKTYRLPTEAEWEYAARGGQQADGTKYAGSGNIDEVAWFGHYNDAPGTPGNGNSTTHPVGQKRPNGLGLYDMSGNVKEWCSDWYDEKYYSQSPSVNPQGPSGGWTYRLSRGGHWDDNAWWCRVSHRDHYSPIVRNSYVGFRVVCER